MAQFRRPSRRHARAGFALLGALPAAGFALDAAAIQPRAFEHQTEADFEPGGLDGVVITAQGRIQLAPKLDPADGFPDTATAVYDAVAIGDHAYLVLGPSGALAKVGPQGDAELLAELTQGQPFALAAYRGGLVAACAAGGQEGAVTLVSISQEGETEELATLAETPYAWAVLPQDDGSLILGVGSPGKVVRWAPGQDDPAAVETLLETEHDHVLSLAQAQAGTLYAGTSGEGLVYRLTPDGQGGYDAFVVLDAAEPEIAALLVGEDGTLYAATADTEQAKPGRLEEPNDVNVGEADTSEDPAEADDPEADPAESDEDAAAEPDAADEPAIDANEQADAAPDAPAAELADAAPAKPTPEMRDRLRELLRKRLEASRKSGALAAGGLDAGDADAPKGRPARAAESTSGNAVYAIDSLGFVTEVFRDSVAIYDLAWDADGHLLAATGDEGQVYRIHPAAPDAAVVGDLDAKQAAALVVLPSGPVVGSAQPAGAVRLDTDPSAQGVYISPVLDADRVSLWGQASITATLPGEAALLVETRSGNVADPDAGPWSAWSDARSFGPDPDRGEFDPLAFPVEAPPARYLQYRLTLVSDGESAPNVDAIRLSHTSPNQAPSIDSLTFDYPELESDPDADRDPEIDLEWETADPDEDRLRYTLEARAADSARFVPLATDFEDDSFAWDTRRAPDGRYVVRLTATDAPDNPADMALTRRRVSDPLVVDNTPPAITGVAVETRGRSATISADLSDALSILESIGYAVDDDEEFQTALPEDLLLDSTQERWSVTLRGLARGAHVLTLRARDARGNVARAAVPFTID
ncbi:MAG: hypothetical protein AAF612_02320 [Planctomycetota bacterium]